MIILSWNIKGMGRVGKRLRIKEVLRERKVDVVFFQETKKARMVEGLVRSLWPWDPDGTVEGLLCVWRPSVFLTNSCCSSRNVIIVPGILLPDFECVLANVYAPNDVVRRGLFWYSIVRLKTSFQKPWCLGGHFNEVRNPWERKGYLRRDREIKDFNDFIDLMEVTELPLLGRQFTWCNAMDGEKWSKLDRFLLSPEWVHMFKFKFWGLPRYGSDHCPIILMEDVRDWGPRPFRFINAWVLHPQFLSFVKQSWEELGISVGASFVISSKLKVLKLKLKQWNLEVFGDIKHNLKVAKEVLHKLELVAESRLLDDSEKERRNVLRGEVWKWSTREEWKNRILLNSLTVDGNLVEDPEKLKEEVFRYCKGLSSKNWKVRPKLIGQFKSIGGTPEVQLIESEFTLAKIWEAVKMSKGNKAPGPDGFNLACF
ncbi:uncharacterized protein LOC114261263 [Camellia sinensis]|uniref:uncharacterized protein LOC114261263 n=1 Tax=Camellia sinensis TaxID=4442 RepID=UPI0010359A1E|nr:uncharacterized protein LOC114261263 [Camellia sinensis]